MCAANGSTASAATGGNSRRRAVSRERRYEQPRATVNMFQQPEHGTLARRVRVEPGETRRVRFAITWNYPLGAIYWFNRAQPGEPEYAGEPPTWTKLLRNAMGRFARERGGGLRAMGRARSSRPSPFATRSSAPRRRPRSSTPSPARSASCAARPSSGSKAESSGAGRASISARDPARGAAPTSGTTSRRSHGSFPALERTLRETEFTYNQLPNGGLTFRQRLPLGSGFDIIGPCADGHFGAIDQEPIASGGTPATTPGFGASGQTSDARSNMRGRRKIPIVGIRRRPACSGAASTIRSTWSCSGRTPG